MHIASALHKLGRAVCILFLSGNLSLFSSKRSVCLNNIAPLKPDVKRIDQTKIKMHTLVEATR
jgi:hypothetical protein